MPNKGVADREMMLVSGSFDHTIGLWRRRENMGPTETLEREIKNGGELIDLSDDEEDKDEAEDWEFSLILEGHESEVKNVAWSPSSQYLATCSRDKSIWIWEDVGEEGDDEWETIAVLQEHTADVKCIAWRENDGNGEVLASGSYDDTVRIWREVEDGEWGSVAELEGHKGTVWALEWEPRVSQEKFDPEREFEMDGDADAEGFEDSPLPTKRLLSCSHDCTIRIWSLTPAPPPQNRPSYLNSGIPSTMRPAPAEETWTCTATLPKVHDLPIYSISWSPKTGRVVSTGADSKVAIYEERTKGRSSVGGEIEHEWVVLGVLEGGHGPYEINHVTWCTRYDPGKNYEGEEMVITTGDDGAVRAWTMEMIMPVPAKNVIPAGRVRAMTLEDKVEAIMAGKSLA